MRSKICTTLLLMLMAASWPMSVQAESEYSLVIKDHRFDPAEFKIPAGRQVKLVIQNQDRTPEEFESEELNREKVISAGQSVVIYIGPLQPGRYPFFGEFHEETAKGVIIAE